MFGLEFLLALLPQALGAGATAAGTAATAAGASGIGGLLGSAGAGLTGVGSSLAGMGAGAGLLGRGLSSLPMGMLQGMQSSGLLGNVTDATGGMETAINNPNNIGGGLLGSATPYLQKGAGAFGEAMMKRPQQEQPMQQAPAMPMSGGEYKPISRSTNPDEEMRKRRLAYLTRRY